MGMNNEVALRTEKVALSVNTLFAGWFYVSVIGKVSEPYKNDVVGRESFIRPSARGDDEAF